MTTIAPTFLNFAAMLHGRIFRIPEYQRCYSWESKQRRELFDDILKLDPTANDAHFMATMVVLKKEQLRIGGEPFESVEVVDGQQRLTTLIIFLKALSKVLVKGKKNDEKKRGAELASLLVKGDDVSAILLRSNHDTNNYFYEYLKTGSIPKVQAAASLGDRSLINAMNECEGFVSEWMGTQKKDPLDLYGILRSRLELILHEINDEATVYRVFEVLNSRGLSVSWLDRLKSDLMAVAFEGTGATKAGAIAQLHTTWTNIYRCIGLRQATGKDALKYAATLWPEYDADFNKVVSEELAKHSLLYWSANQKNPSAAVIRVSSWIEKVATAVDGLMKDRRLGGVSQITQARLLYCAIELHPKLREQEKKEVLEKWERVSFRIFGLCHKDARTKAGEFVRVARQIQTNSLKATPPTGGWKKYVIEDIETLEDTDHDIRSAIKIMTVSNCYDGWQEELRYFFHRYEEHLAMQNKVKFSNAHWTRIWEANPSESIEHMHPQGWSTGPANPWRKSVHRLGNLVLLPPGLNSQLGDSLPAVKAPQYRKTGMLIAVEAARAMAKKWTVEDAVQREKKLLEWARHQWG